MSIEYQLMFNYSSLPFSYKKSIDTKCCANCNNKWGEWDIRCAAYYYLNVGEDMTCHSWTIKKENK